MKLKSSLSKVRIELECTPEEFALAKVGECVDGDGGSSWQIQSKNEKDSSITAVLCVTEHFVLPFKNRP